MRPPTTTQVIPGALVNIVLKADQPTGRTVSGKIQDVLTRGNHPRGIKVRLVDGRVGRVQSMLSSSSSSSPSSSSATATGNSTATASASTSATSNGFVETDGLDGSDDWGSGSGSGMGFGEWGDFSGHSQGGGRRRGRGRGRGRGPRGRQNDYDDGTGGGYPPEQQALGLDAYIKPARNQRRGGGRGGGAGSTSTSTAGSGSNSREMSGVRQKTAGELSVCPVCRDFEGDEAAVAHHVANHFGD